MPTAQRDYYDILGVNRSVTADEIKKAYRKLARQYHPDLHTGSRKGEMEKKFKELNEAHEVLGDPDSRKKYDRYGHRWQEAEAYEKARQQAGAGRGFGGGRHAGPEFTTEQGFDFGDVFENLFGGRARGGAGFRSGASPGQDLETEARLTLREVLTGVTRRVAVTEPGGPNGRTASRTIDIKIPAGVQDGTRVRVPGKGGPGRGGGSQAEHRQSPQCSSWHARQTSSTVGRTQNRGTRPAAPVARARAARLTGLVPGVASPRREASTSPGRSTPLPSRNGWRGRPW